MIRSRILHIIIVAYQRAVPLRIMIDCILIQSYSQWQIHIIHDGPAPKEVKDVVDSYNDARIQYYETPTVNGAWGHPNRKIALKQLSLNHRDYVLITNDDNYYVPDFIRIFMNECRNEFVGFVYCNTVHSYEKYNLFVSKVKENCIDMGSFIVKLDVAKRVGFNHTHLSADGKYAEDCANYCKRRRLRIVHVEKPLFVHN